MLQQEEPQAQAARLQALRGGTAGVSASLRKDHKEMHSLVSKLGKAIDAHTHPSLATVFDPEAFSGAEQTALINAAIAQHLCREQRFETSDMFVEEAGVEPAPREGRELRAELSALHAAAEGLRDGQSFAALAWASSHNLGSAFAFELHKLRYVALLRGGDSRAALAYLRRPDAFLTPSEEAGEEQRRELRRLRRGRDAWVPRGRLRRRPGAVPLRLMRERGGARRLRHGLCGPRGRLAHHRRRAHRVSVGRRGGLPPALRLADHHLVPRE